MIILKYIFKVIIRIITLSLILLLCIMQIIWILLCPIVYIIGYIFFFKSVPVFFLRSDIVTNFIYILNNLELNKRL